MKHPPAPTGARLLTGALLLLSLACASHRAPGTARTTGSPVRGAVATGQYPNLFTSTLGVSDAEVQAKVRASFQQLFHGNDSTQRLYYPVGQDMAYVLDVLHDDVRTEGLSYGMMIAVQLDHKAEFDRIWKWTKTYSEHRSGPRKGYFAWQLRRDGTVIDQTPASDGEEWFVTALFFASARWGNGQGIYDYHAEAQKILDAMVDKEAGGQHADSTLNMFDTTVNLIRFVPNLDSRALTDPSYHLPHFYEIWARSADRNNPLWCDAAAASRAYLLKAAHPVTGLSPEYSTYDGAGRATYWNSGAAEYRFDAWRVAANIGVDHMWFGDHDELAAVDTRLQDFFYSQGLDRYVNQYRLDGTPVAGAGRSGGQLAMNAVASLASTSPHRVDFVRQLWSMTVPDGRYRYYDGLLYMLAMLETSGNFRAYAPKDARLTCRP